MKAGCATLVVLNKWDLPHEELDLKHERARVARKLRLRPKIVTSSALNGRNVHQAAAEAIDLAERSAQRIPTTRAEQVPQRRPGPCASRRACAASA